MGKKYIIELEDKPFHKENGDFLYRVKGFNSLVFDMTGVGKLTPYTEPNLEQVRKEAYENGYENGFVAGHLKAEKSGQSFYEDGYRCGLNDAWEAARKICLEEDDGGIPASAIRDIFNVRNYRYAVKDYSASECIEKIRQYEQEQKQLHVGDEVNAPFGKAIVVNIDSVAEKIWLVYADGHGGFEYFKDAPTKTGRHFPEIAEVLQKMKE